jgi:hypothetical protein
LSVFTFLPFPLYFLSGVWHNFVSDFLTHSSNEWVSKLLLSTQLPSNFCSRCSVSSFHFWSGSFQAYSPQCTPPMVV